MVVSWIRNNSSFSKNVINKNVITLFTNNSNFRLNLTQRVTGSLVYYNSISPPKIVRLSEKLQLTATICNEI